MKKTDFISFGVPENRVKEFQKAYWADVRQSARNIAVKERCTKAEDLKAAILSMIQLMPDTDKLERILYVINRQYYYMCLEASEMKAPEAPETAFDAVDVFTQAAEKEAVQGKGGGTECP